MGLLTKQQLHETSYNKNLSTTDGKDFRQASDSGDSVGKSTEEEFSVAVLDNSEIPSTKIWKEKYF